MTTQTPSTFRVRLRHPELPIPPIVAEDSTFTGCCTQGNVQVADWRRSFPDLPERDVWVERIDTDKHGRQTVERVAQLSGKRGA